MWEHHHGYPDIYHKSWTVNEIGWIQKVKKVECLSVMCKCQTKLRPDDHQTMLVCESLSVCIDKLGTNSMPTFLIGNMNAYVFCGFYCNSLIMMINCDENNWFSYSNIRQFI